MRLRGPNVPSTWSWSALDSCKLLSSGFRLWVSGKSQLKQLLCLGESPTYAIPRYGCKLLSFGDVSMYDFMVAFLSVFLAGQAAGMLFQFTTSRSSSRLTC